MILRAGSVHSGIQIYSNTNFNLTTIYKSVCRKVHILYFDRKTLYKCYSGCRLKGGLQASLITYVKCRLIKKINNSHKLGYLGLECHKAALDVVGLYPTDAGSPLLDAFPKHPKRTSNPRVNIASLKWTHPLTVLLTCKRLSCDQCQLVYTTKLILNANLMKTRVNWK